MSRSEESKSLSKLDALNKKLKELQNETQRLYDDKEDTNDDFETLYSSVDISPDHRESNSNHIQNLSRMGTPQRSLLNGDLGKTKKPSKQLNDSKRCHSFTDLSYSLKNNLDSRIKSDFDYFNNQNSGRPRTDSLDKREISFVSNNDNNNNYLSYDSFNQSKILDDNNSNTSHNEFNNSSSPIIKDNHSVNFDQLTERNLGGTRNFNPIYKDGKEINPNIYDKYYKNSTENNRFDSTVVSKDYNNYSISVNDCQTNDANVDRIYPEDHKSSFCDKKFGSGGNNDEYFKDSNVARYVDDHKKNSMPNNEQLNSPNDFNSNGNQLKLKRLRNILEKEFFDKEQQIHRQLARNYDALLQKELEKLGREFASRRRQDIAELEEEWTKKIKNIRLDFQEEKENFLSERQRLLSAELELKECIENLKLERKNLSSETEKFRNDHFYSLKQIEHLKKELQTTEIARASAQKQLNILQEKFDEVNSKLQSENLNVNRIKCDLDHFVNMAHSENSKCRQFELKLSELEKSKSTLENQVQTLMLELRENQSKYESLMNSYNLLKDENYATLRESKRLQTKYNELMEINQSKILNEKNSLQVVEKLRENEKYLKEEINSLKEKFRLMDPLDRELKNLRYAISNSKLEIERLRDENSSLRAENKQLSMREAKLLVEAQSTSNDLFSAHQELHSLRKRLQITEKARNSFNNTSSSTNLVNLYNNNNLTDPAHPLNTFSYKSSNCADINATKFDYNKDTIKNSNLNVGSKINFSDDYAINNIATKENFAPMKNDLNFNLNGYEDYNVNSASVNRRKSNATSGNWHLYGSDYIPKNSNNVKVDDFKMKDLIQNDIDEGQNESLEQQLTLLQTEKTKIDSQLARFPSVFSGRTIKERENKLSLDKKSSEVEASIQKIKQILRFRRNSKTS